MNNRLRNYRDPFANPRRRDVIAPARRRAATGPASPAGEPAPGFTDVAGRWIGEHPVVGLGAGLATGVLFGWLLKRR